MGLLSLLGDVSAVGTAMSSFTPAAAAIGGTVLGLASAGKLVMTGRILGISGAFKGLVRGDTSAWRFAFLGGMAAGAVAAAATMPGAFEVLPHTFTLTRSALGGLLVGFGAAMGNGCTSGHGICGNARFSIRSMVNTLCFMASGALTATRTNTAAAAGLNTGHAAALDMPNPQILMELAMLPATTLGTFIILGLLGKKASQQSHKKESARGGSSFLKFTELLSEAAAGFYFSQGLALSGMVRPSKVAAFLSPTTPAWDPSLMFVMAAGLAVATPAFQGVFRGWFPAASQKPIVCDRYNMPELSTLEWKLVLGGLVFGVGWGLTGMCPGPAIVSLIVPGAQNVVFVATMLLGMVIETATCG